MEHFRSFRLLQLGMYAHDATSFVQERRSRRSTAERVERLITRMPYYFGEDVEVAYEACLPCRFVTGGLRGCYVFRDIPGNYGAKLLLP